MSTLLEQASLVLIPSGYKEDVVYSQIPTNGNGDLSFTRASNGTRVNSAGLVEVCPWNLAEYSNTFSNAAWVKSSCTFTSGQNDPNGGTNGWRYLSSVASSGYSYQNGVLQNGVQYTFYIYAKSNTGSNQTMYFTANSGSFTSPAFTLTSTWQLCSWTFTANATGDNILFGYNPSATLDLLVYGAQLNIGSTAKPYFPTTDRLNVPRLTYQNGGGGCPSLLLEKQSTNALTYSEDFTQADWPKQNTIVTANATTSPDGTQNADKLIANTTNARHLIFQAITTSNTHTFTTYAKAGENSFLIMRLDTDTPEVKNWFNLSNGTVGTSQGGSPTITSVGNGWYRCSMQYTPSTSSNIYAVLYTAKTDGVEAFAGNDSDGTYIWGAQLEASSYPTSYIPTTSASATRVLDECSKTGISSLIGQTEGVIFVDFQFQQYDGQPKWVAFLGGGASYIGIYTNSSSKFVCEISNSGANQFINDSYTFAINQRYKIALAYKANDFVLYINGTQVATDSSGTVPSTSQLSLQYNTTPDNLTSRTYNQVVVFPTRLTNAELASLTTL